jgi:hypothetical protein
LTSIGGPIQHGIFYTNSNNQFVNRLTPANARTIEAGMFGGSGAGIVQTIASDSEHAGGSLEHGTRNGYEGSALLS